MIPDRTASDACRSVFIMIPAPNAVRPRRRPLRAAGVAPTLLILALALLSGAFAQPSLYGPDAPSDVAFLRVVNASPNAVAAAVGGGTVEELPPGNGTDYTPVPSDEVRFEVRRPEADEPEVVEPSVGAEAFVTLLVLEDETRLLEDEVLRDISRGLLVFVNATDEPLTLRVEDGSVAFEDVGEEPASRTMAETAVGFDVVDANGDVVGSVERRLFARGVAHTILAFEGPDGPAVSYLAASLAD